MNEAIPSFESLESVADRVRERIDALIACAADLHRDLQDLDAEADGLSRDETTKILVKRADIAFRIRELDRQLMIAGCELVLRSDEQWETAQRLATDLRNRSNGPWRDLTQTLPPPEELAA